MKSLEFFLLLIFFSTVTCQNGVEKTGSIVLMNYSKCPDNYFNGIKAM